MFSPLFSGHPVLDIVIGLVFIYLLYSLLASAINEFVAVLFAYRQRMLEIGIEQMLDGNSVSYYWWDKLANLFLWIKYLIIYYYNSKLKRDPDPRLYANIDRKVFFRSCTINHKDSLKKPRVKLNKKASLFAAQVINHPIYRRKSQHSLLIKKPSYLSAAAFSDILIDVLSDRKSTTNGIPVLLTDIRRFVDTKLVDNKGLRNILNVYIDQANGDLQKFKLLLENWYDETMDSVTGWYKRQSYKSILIISFLLAIVFNVSTINIVTTLSRDKKAREALLQNASAFIKSAYADTLHQSARATSFSDTTLQITKERIGEFQKLYKENIEENNMLIGLGWNDFGYAQALLSYQLKLKDPKTNTKALKQPEKPGFWDKIYFVIVTSFTTPRVFIGFLLTAIAMSMGAPFWFDLLNKLVNLRGSGVKPKNKTEDSPSKTLLLNQKPTPNSFG